MSSVVLKLRIVGDNGLEQGGHAPALQVVLMLRIVGDNGLEHRSHGVQLYKQQSSAA